MIYRTKGVCASQITFDVETENGVQVVKNVAIIGGCDGNHKGLSKLVDGMPVDFVIDRLQGIQCGYKSSSCPDQLAQALLEYKKEQQ